MMSLRINELNKSNKSNENTLSICHWNLNSITKHDFSKLSQLKAYIPTKMISYAYQKLTWIIQLLVT